MTGSDVTERHIVVADDEAHIGRIIKLKMEQGPFRVSLAFDGQEAVDILEQSDRVDAVVLDVMMPRMSGLDVLEKIRADERMKDVPCIILTAAGEEEYEREARRNGATAFLTKPFSPKKLYALIAKLTGVATDESAEYND
ncbi:MAG TPA: response regulator [Gemmatimonadaceae bacterium]|jgi:DNA-binding response OmpR family regulator|nr:response regulator [Gemmatimonadaceae bacterium]